MANLKRERKALGQTYQVKKALRIGNCKMKVGDCLTIVDCGLGSISNYVKFTNSRLPAWTFKVGSWIFWSMVEKEPAKEAN